jgi:hypothetical protein
MIYRVGESLPSVSLVWRDTERQLIDFSSGWTLSAKVTQLDGTVAFEKTAGVVGNDTVPNVVVAWAAEGEIASLGVGWYWLDVEAVNTQGLKRESRRQLLRIAA